MRALLGRHWFHIWVVAFTLVMSWAGLTSLRNDHEIRDVVAAQQADVLHDQAVQCVTSWEVRDKLRAGDEAAARAGAQFGAEVGTAALIGVATNPQPEAVAKFRALIKAGLADDAAFERVIAEVRGNVPDPTCDLAAAKRRLR